jgi:hypothetical protein
MGHWIKLPTLAAALAPGEHTAQPDSTDDACLKKLSRGALSSSTGRR